MQVSLQSMLCGSAASSFTDEIHKWQKQLQTIEAVLTVWLEVQDKWVELEDVSIEHKLATLSDQKCDDAFCFNYSLR